MTRPISKLVLLDALLVGLLTLLSFKCGAKMSVDTLLHAGLAGFAVS